MPSSAADLSNFVKILAQGGSQTTRNSVNVSSRPPGAARQRQVPGGRDEIVTASFWDDVLPHLNIRLTDAERRALDALAFDKTGGNVSELVRRILTPYLEPYFSDEDRRSGYSDGQPDLFSRIDPDKPQGLS